MKKRVAVTGIGVITCLGNNVEEFRRNLFDGKCGISVKEFSFANQKAWGAVGSVGAIGELPFFEDNGLIYDRCSHLALIAAKECVDRSNHALDSLDPYRMGIAVGTSLGGMLSGDEFHSQWLRSGLSAADADLLKQYPLHAIADVLALEFGFKGVKNVISTACSAGANSIGYAFDMIQNGRCDLMLAGGVDPMSRFSFAGFRTLKALDHEPCKPYSTSSGINLGEGAAFLLLETFESAMDRKQPILAEVLGYGLSADAYHQTAPDMGGNGAIRAMKSALLNSACTLDDVDYVNGHGTGTSANDFAERKAFRSIFRDHMNIPLSSIKGSVGHCLGAAGAIEAVATILALQSDSLPPTVNYQNTEASDINYVPNLSQSRKCDVALSNSFAFGGNNCCLALGKGVSQPPVNVASTCQLDAVVITGIGCLGVGGENIQELALTFDSARNCILSDSEILGVDGATAWIGEMPDVNWKAHIPPKFLRRTDVVTKLAMGSGKQALDDSGIRVVRDTMERIGVIYATGTGPLETIERINRGLVLDGVDSVSSSDFPNSVINAAPGNFCIAYSLKGPTSTLSTGGTSFLTALSYAYELLNSRKADAIIVIGADECNEPLVLGIHKAGLLSSSGEAPFSPKADGMVLSQGSVALVLERESDAISQQKRIYATVSGYALTSDHPELGSINHDGQALTECLKRAIHSSGLEHIDVYMSCAGGVPGIDKAEKAAISEVFDSNTTVLNVQTLLGSTAGTVGGYGLLGALHSFLNGLSGIPRFEHSENAISNIGEIRSACIGTISLGGSYAAVVIEKYSVMHE